MRLISNIYESVRVERLPANELGRDFVVGDLHGHYDSFIKLLRAAEFDPKRDRVFATGDLINRGPQSEMCLGLLNQPWFHTTLGNHEMCFVVNTCQLENPNGKSRCEEIARAAGGNWYLGKEPESRHDLANQISLLPHVLVVGPASPDRFHVVHGALSHSLEAFQPIDNYEVDRLEHLSDAYSVIPNLTEHRQLWETRARDDNATLSLTYSGHTPNACQLRLSQSHLNIDLGAGHPDSPILGHSRLGLMCHQTKTLWMVETNHPEAEVLEDRDAFYWLNPPAHLISDHPEVFGQGLSGKIAALRRSEPAYHGVAREF